MIIRTLDLKLYHQLIIFAITNQPTIKTQFEDHLLRYDCGFDNPKSYDNPVKWQQNEFYKNQSPSVTVDVRNLKTKTATDGYITQYLDLSTSA